MQKTESLIIHLMFIFLMFSQTLIAEIPIEPITGKDAYQILGISRDMSDMEILKVYRKLAMKYHPDRFEAAPPNLRDIAEDNFKIIKACYEAIMSGDQQKLINGITFGPLGPHKAHMPYHSSGKVWQSFSDWIREFYSVHSSWESPEPEFKVMKREARFFEDGIHAIYENELGAIVQTKISRFFWIPTGESTVYPMYFNPSGSIDNFKGSMLDTRLPTGRIPVVGEDGAHIKMGPLTFIRSRLLQAEHFNKALALNQFQLAPELNDIELGLWNYYVFFKGGTYTIFALNSYLAKYIYQKDTLVRMFVGNDLEMEEISVRYDPRQRVISIPSRGLSLSFFDAQGKWPLFDRWSGLFMGELNISEHPLKVYASSHGPYFEGQQPVYEVPALSKERRENFSVARLLGDLVDIPMAIRTPMDSILKEEIRAEASTETLLFGRGIRKRGESAATSQAHQVERTTNRGTSFRDTLIARVDFLQYAAKTHPKLALFLNYQEGHDLRLLVEAFIYAYDAQIETSQMLIPMLQNTQANEERAMLLLKFFDYFNTWETQEKNLYLLESVVNDMIGKPGVMAIVAIFQIPKIKSYLNHPRVRDLVLKLMSAGQKPVRTYLVSNTFGSEMALQRWLAAQQSIDCNNLLGGPGRDSP